MSRTEVIKVKEKVRTFLYYLKDGKVIAARIQPGLEGKALIEKEASLREKRSNAKTLESISEHKLRYAYNHTVKCKYCDNACIKCIYLACKKKMTSPKAVEPCQLDSDFPFVRSLVLPVDYLLKKSIGPESSKCLNTNFSLT